MKIDAYMPDISDTGALKETCILKVHLLTMEHN